MAGFAEGPATEEHSASLLHAMGLGGGHWNTFIMRSYVAVREQAGREASPTKAIFDSSKAPRARKKGDLARSGDGIALVLNRRASATAVIEERSFVLTWHISTMVNQGWQSE